jgi:hypothetical protein
MFRFARDFALKKKDAAFHARLALALARSFYTSTRFELNTTFAKNMYLRSHFLLDRLVAHKGVPWEDFVFPVEVLYY